MAAAISSSADSNQRHWAFVPPHLPPLPHVQNRGWPKNEIDHFVLAQLEAEQLQPSAQADKTTLLRRVTLDLTGLPPTPSEVGAFLADESSDAYERVVDRLLASPRYGERMAIVWLDAARYADTSGYQSDGERSMWRWRDWVIDAFNQNMPFDRFTIEQIAGDMLPGATIDQRIATGFNRNHRGNAEGGIIPEEYAVEYVVDRVDTTSTVWLGLTIGCARCHDHKFDPISQKEYYRLFAFFNHVPEKGRAVKFGNSPPMIKAPTPAQQLQLQLLEERLVRAEESFRKMLPAISAAQSEWETSVRSARLRVAAHRISSDQASEPTAGARVDRTISAGSADSLEQWTISDGLRARFEFEGNTANTIEAGTSGAFTNGEPEFAMGYRGQAGAFDGKRFVSSRNLGDFGFLDKFSCGAWVNPARISEGAILSRMVESSQGEGYSVCLQAGKVQVNLVKRWLDDALRVETERALVTGEWHHLMVTYDGSRSATGVKVYFDGKSENLKVNLDELNQSFKTSEPFRIGSGGGAGSRFQGFIDDVRVYDRVLTADEVEVVSTASSIGEIASIPVEKRTSGERKKIGDCFIERHSPETIRQARVNLDRLRKEKEEFFEHLPTTMVMEEMPNPRNTFVLIRGQYDKPGEKVTPGVPASLSLHREGCTSRLDFARWIVSPSNPLTARVAVNHYWQMFFGSGLVRTTEDFGTRGERPTHPELLDWLATTFVRSGWNVKAVQKLLVMSATYRQSSRVTPDLLQKDPENRLLARGPRLRLSAEMLRDQALAVSGLLVERVGGPSVLPYQPKGLWKDLSGADYPQDKGENLYRRSLYTFWKRTSAPPTMTTFDAAGRETCSVRQTRTSTPLQALTLMNDLTFVEAARVLAERMMGEGGTTPEERIAFAFRLATARLPRPTELQILLNGFQDHWKAYHENPEAALALVSSGESRRTEKWTVSDLAAYTATANLILNLDETITKE